MRILEHEQNTPEWKEAKIGVASASNFDKIMTSIQLKPSKSDYIFHLAAERISGESAIDSFSNNAIEHGNYYEDEAIAAYEIENDIEVLRPGLCLPYEGAMYGASPDALIESCGGLEIKCPSLPVHLQYLHEGVLPKAYIHQVYGGLFVSNYDYWDFMSYHPQYEPFTIRTLATDKNYLKWKEAFEPILTDFLERLDKITNQ